MFWTGIFSPSLDKDQWRRYVEAQRRVPPLGLTLFFELSHKKPDPIWIVSHIIFSIEKRVYSRTFKMRNV